MTKFSKYDDWWITSVPAMRLQKDLVKPRIFANLGVFGRGPRLQIFDI